MAIPLMLLWYMLVQRPSKRPLLSASASLQSRSGEHSGSLYITTTQEVTP